jgi:D-alanyl-lipoteichoic acid acyltransferase DltB (MBOAT superfamily)
MGLAAGSSTYFIFVAAIFFVYWAAPQTRLLRLGVVLLANYFFCARYGLFYLALIPACGTADFLAGLGLMRFRHAGVRRLLVGVSVAVNLALLVGSRHMGAVIGPMGWDWVFPLGLSFYTFQALTYTLDLYRRDAEGTTSLLAHLSAVSFFPTLQAGPITRVSELIRQFAERRPLDRTEGGRALFLIGLGLLKKAHRRPSGRKPRQSRVRHSQAV